MTKNITSLIPKSMDNSVCSSINVLLIGFNRSDLIQSSLNRLKAISGCNIWVAVDGPRPGNLRDFNEHVNIKSILSESKIPGNQIKMSDRNFGCRDGVVAAISWFFTHNESGIVLEDDIEIDEGYLYCMQHLLIAYQDDPSIMSISSHGTSSNTSLCTHTNEFLLMPLCRVWGWASWRRAWLQHLEILQKTQHFSLRRLYRFMPNFCRTFDSALRLHQCKNSLFDTWDYEWNFTHLLTGCFSITPSDNYCLNHGFGEYATHTLDPHGQPWEQMEKYDFSSLRDSLITPIAPSRDESSSVLMQCGFPKYDSKLRELIKLVKYQVRPFLIKS